MRVAHKDPNEVLGQRSMTLPIAGQSHVTACMLIFSQLLCPMSEAK